MIRSAEEFVVLRDSDIKAEYDRSAMEEAPIAVWRDVIERFPDHRRWVAHNKTVPVEILEVLCEFDASTRWFVAGKRKLSATLFERLSQDEDSDVRIAICANKKTPLEILERLLQDVNEDVARVAAKHYKRRVEELESKTR
ncbi:hypothetical protein OKW98_23985 [Pseudomonas sp. KU26590]|uniref:hypothetical protein n=1 Tax=Pseudomonas sp. KU26590 TaxID=2991051 RepID=UPI00223E10F9|nr:hypothetical protein [Pseudomonas sp. KU26590]UZJ59568.1 hypothetical protein OKW98_23985 [Pseudomonas sp. KU26590]